MYAIVDIETTGSFAANNGITELAIVRHDGKKIIDRFESLVNPGQPIPRYIQALTGITNEMLLEAPAFPAIALHVYELLNDAIFVAHNVNFDYSFLKYQLAAAGFELNSRKLCTVRLGRKVFPGLQGYSLGKLCRQLDISIENRHRAGGDADATVELFEKILLKDTQGHVESMLKGRSTEQYLPPNLSSDQIKDLPYTAGVYYFHDKKGKVIYVGKAKNLRNRVCSHFSNNNPGLRKQEFLRNIHTVTWKDCGTELMAYLFECIEIKRLWPRYNSSLKRFEQVYGMYIYEDRNGYQRLVIEKDRKHLQACYRFSMLSEGRQVLQKLARQFDLCPKLCFMQSGAVDCEGIKETYCKGACEGKEEPEAYNKKVSAAVQFLVEKLPSFALKDAGRNHMELSCVLIEKGKFYGMGYLDKSLAVEHLEDLKAYITAYPGNDYMKGLVYQFAEKWPAKKLFVG